MSGRAFAPRTEPQRLGQPLALAALLATIGVCACLGEVLEASTPGGDPDGGGTAADGGPGGLDGGTGKPDGGPADGGSTISGDRFPASSIFYQDISGAPVDPNSMAIINHLAAVGWGSGNMQI